MGIDLAAVVDESGTLYWLPHSACRGAIAECHGLTTGNAFDEPALQLLCFMAYPQNRYFDLDAYGLSIAGPPRPWLTDRRQKLVSDACRELMARRLALDPIPVTSQLDLRKTTMTRLPRLLVIDSVEIGRSDITELADGTVTVGDLNLKNSSVAKLPEGLKVFDTLNIENTEIDTLPDSLYVRVEIRLGGSRVTRIPPHLTCRIDGQPRDRLRGRALVDQRPEAVVRAPRVSASQRCATRVVGDSGALAGVEYGYVEPDVIEAVSKNPLGWDCLNHLEGYRVRLW